MTRIGRCKIGTEIEEVVLDAHEHGVEFGEVFFRMEPRKPETRICFVDCAVGFNAQIMFETPFAAAEAGRAVIAGPRVYLVELDHMIGVSSLPRGGNRSHRR